jgi:hypothetical protein
VVCRCTKAVLVKLPYEKNAQLNSATNILGDWYINRLNIGPNRLLLCTAEKSLLAVVLPAKDLPNFPIRLQHGLRELLRRLEIPEAAVQREISEMEAYEFAPTNNRRVLGSMNDLAVQINFQFPHSKTLTDCALQVAETPCSPIGWANPGEKTRQLFGIPGRWHPRLDGLDVLS